MRPRQKPQDRGEASKRRGEARPRQHFCCLEAASSIHHWLQYRASPLFYLRQFQIRVTPMSVAKTVACCMHGACITPNVASSYEHINIAARSIIRYLEIQCAVVPWDEITPILNHTNNSDYFHPSSDWKLYK